MAMARKVLTSDTASAPASSAALANDATSVTFGVSLGHDGERRDLAHRAHHVERAVQAAPERDAAFLDVRAGDVELERGHAVGVREDPRQLDVLIERAAADVDDDGGAALAQLGQLLGDEAVHADTLQPDRIQHARGRLDDAFRRMALAFLEEEPFHRDGAECREVQRLCVLDAVAEAPAGRDERIRQRQRADGNGEVAHHAQTMSAASRTGPPMHERT
jgi:hypothetical protein